MLNATFEPLSIVSSRRAVLLVLGTKAETIHATERVFRAERVTIPEPSVVRLVRYVMVAACRACNTRKEDRLPHEAGMVLRTTPVAPRHRVQLLALCGNTSEDWSEYMAMDGGAGRSLPMSDSGRVGSLADRGAQGVGGRTA